MGFRKTVNKPSEKFRTGALLTPQNAARQLGTRLEAASRCPSKLDDGERGGIRRAAGMPVHATLGRNVIAGWRRAVVVGSFQAARSGGVAVKSGPVRGPEIAHHTVRRPAVGCRRNDHALRT